MSREGDPKCDARKRPRKMTLENEEPNMILNMTPESASCNEALKVTPENDPENDRRKRPGRICTEEFR